MGSGKGKARRVRGNVLAQEEKPRVLVLEDGTKEWRDEEGEFHRTDGPAIEGADGSKKWCVHGRFHRVGGPAFEGATGTREWLQNGRLHRADGPAVEHADGTKEWWLDGKSVSVKDWEWRSMMSRAQSDEVEEVVV